MLWAWNITPGRVCGIGQGQGCELFQEAYAKVEFAILVLWSSGTDKGDEEVVRHGLREGCVDMKQEASKSCCGKTSCLLLDIGK